MSPFKLYKSREFAAPQPVERATILRPTTGGPYRLTPLVHVPIGELKTGDVVDVAACCAQVSSKIPHWLMVGSHLILCDSPRVNAAWSQNDFGRWVEITEAMTTNIINTIHHHPIRTTGRYVVQENWDEAYLTFLVYAAYPTWDGTQTLTVDQDYGRLEGTVQREVTPAELWEFLGAAPPVDPDPEDPPGELINISITQGQATALKEVAALIPNP